MGSRVQTPEDEAIVRHVLIVDDLHEALDMLEQAVREAFADERLAIVRADSVAAARLKITQQAFQLALVDLHLGDGHGAEVIADLSGRQPGCMAVVATIFDDDDHLFRALQAGAQGYLLKDRAPAWLATQLRGIGAGQPPLSPAIARRLMRHFQATPGMPGTSDGRARAGHGPAAPLEPVPAAVPARVDPAASATPTEPARRPLAPAPGPSAASPPAVEALTPREREVLGLLAKGVHIADIARVMGISRHTVGDHVKNLYRKLNISSRAEAALEARDRGLT